MLVYHDKIVKSQQYSILNYCRLLIRTYVHHSLFYARWNDSWCEQFHHRRPHQTRRGPVEESLKDGHPAVVRDKE